MTQYFDLVEHYGADMPARYYVNGRRVSRREFQSIKDRAHTQGRIDCFSTKGRQLPGGKIRRTNYCVASY